ncbi:MAG: glycosyltransferase family 1 protein [bacterium]
MRIGIDFTPVETAPAGIGQYTINLISKLTELAPLHQFFIYSTKPYLLHKTTNIVIKSRNLPGKGVIWMYQVGEHAKKHKIDVLISTSNHLFSLFFPQTIQFIHDLAPIKYPQFFSKKFALIYKFTTKFVLAKAWKVATVSETVKQELIEFSKQKRQDITVIFPALNKWYHDKPKNLDVVKEKYNLPPRYLLALSTLEPRKNFESIIKSFKLYQEKYHDDLELIIVGKKGWKNQGIMQLLKEQINSNQIKLLGYVPNQELSAIYQAATLYINLSYYEGFGMPILEALCFNKPVIISDIPIYQECFKGFAEFVNPDKIELVAEKIKLSQDKKVSAATTMKARFSWEKSALKLLQTING